MSIDIGWPSIAASASMPPTPQPSTPSPLIIVVCESVPTTRVGVGDGRAVLLLLEHHARQVLQVDLVDDAGVRRHDAEVVERLLPPAQQRVALPVALQLQPRVERERVRRAELVDLHRVVDHQVRRLQRVDAPRVAAERLDRVAHRRQVDDAGHAGEVLQQHARRPERDLAVGGAVRVPRRERRDVVLRDRAPVLVPEQVFEQDLERERQPADVPDAGLGRAHRAGRSRASGDPTWSEPRLPKLSMAGMAGSFRRYHFIVRRARLRRWWSGAMRGGM